MMTQLLTRARRSRTVTLGDGSSRPAASSGPSTGRVVTQFMLASLCALILFGVIGLVAQRRIGINEETRDVSARATLVAHAIVAPLLTNQALVPGTADQRHLDQIVRSTVIDKDIVRIKIWKPDGTIVYSDESALIGRRYPLDADDKAVFRTGATVANLSDLSRPENELERPFGKLLQVYLPVTAVGGQTFLFEMYQRYDGIVEGSHRLWVLFALPLLLSIALLWLAQAPLAWSLARRLRSGQRERERLLRRAIETSNLERRRIAADLHDGVVQHLAGTAYSLAAAAETSRNVATDETQEALTEGITNVRHVIRQLRSLIVEIHPPNLRSEGLRAAITDLTAQLGTHGIKTTLAIDSDVAIGQDAEELCFRAAQEGIRNVVAHSDATEVTVRFAQEGSRAVLSVEDNGCGFDPSGRAIAAKDGHVGLSLLGELANDMGGVLHIRSAPGEGCQVRLEVPWR
jgi:signal transduction histidine kinase